MVLSAVAIAQSGDLPITNHRPNLSGLDQSGFDMVFDNHGLMYAANSAGVLRYDGSDWEYVHTPSAAFSLAVDTLDRVYVGCSGGFGYLQLINEGLKYHPLNADSLSQQYFTQTTIIGDSVIFMGQSQIWVFNQTNKSLNVYKSPDRYALQAVVVAAGKVYVSTEIGSYHWDGNSMSQTDRWIGDNMPPLKIVESTSANAFLVLDINGTLFKSTGRTFQPLTHLGTDLNGLARINDETFVISTRGRGCKIVRARDNKVIANIDYAAGLPDNEIKAISVDMSKGVWVSHEFGFSRIDPLAPVHCLSNDDDLEGNLIQSVVYDGKLIVGTSHGLYRAVLDSIYSDHSKVIRVNNTRALQTTAAYKAMRFLRRKDDREVNKSRLVTTTTKKFEYARWVYQRIEGVNFKCNDLRVFGEVLLIGTNGGLFVFDGKSLRKIDSSPVQQIVSMNSEREFLTIDGFGAKRFLVENDKYTELAFNYDDALILSAYADERSLVWIVNPGKVVAVGFTYQGASVLHELDLRNEHLQKPSIITVNRQLLFVSNSGCYRYNYDKRLLERDTVLTRDIGLIKRHFNDNQGNIWLYNGKVWKCMTKDGRLQIFPYLSLYPDIKQVYRPTSGSPIYFITNANQLYSYDASGDNNEVYQSSVFYKHIFAQSAYSSYKQKVKLNYDENYLRAELAQPDYLGLLKVEYQYTLEGMDDSWTEWSPDNKIDLNFLPEGEYVLKVKSRDVFGREQNMKPVEVVINPPYWRTTWFYFLEVIFFASLVFISTKLNQSKVQNRFLTEGLTVLTIVMIIETLQSIAGSYFSFASSPIIDFAINLCVALIIFPMESLLKYVIRSGGKVPIKIKKSEANSD